MANTTQYPIVYNEIEETLRSHPFGMSRPRLYLLEKRYMLKFNKLLDYTSLGVDNLEQLLEKMREKDLVLVVEPENNGERYWMSVPMVERTRFFLKRNVQKLLNRHSGEIVFSSFEDLYKNKFGAEISYQPYGLNNLDHLCDVLKDILVVRENSSGEKVMVLKEDIPALVEEFPSPSQEEVITVSKKDKLMKVAAKIYHLLKLKKLSLAGKCSL